MATQTFLILLLFVISGSSLKYVYVDKSSHWDKAQEHCRSKYIDLAPVSNEYDMSLLRQAAEIQDSNQKHFLWFGLMRNTTDVRKWMWSGGAEATTFFWDGGQPSSLAEKFGLLINYKWHDAHYTLFSTDFFCYKVHAEREKMTWEEALEFCQENYDDLASVASETEMMLIQKQLQKEERTTKHVWVGLRFLAEEWLWIDGQPLDYEAWGPNEQTQCPAVKRCGALRVNGTQDDVDEDIVHVGSIKEWSLRDCTEKLHFLCY